MTGLFARSTAGAAWIQLTFDPVLCIAVHPDNPRQIFLGTEGGGLLCSNDGGATFTPRCQGFGNARAISALAFVPGAPSQMFAGTTTHGVFFSRDTGQTWEARSAGMEFLNVSALAVRPDNPPMVLTAANELPHGISTRALIYASTNYGQNWTAIFSEPHILSISVEQRAAGSIFAGTYLDGVVMFTLNGWRPLNNGLTSHRIWCLLDDGALLYAGHGDGISISRDRGESWQPYKSGLIATNVTALWRHPSNTAVIIAGTRGGGLYRTEDSGSNWSQINQISSSVQPDFIRDILCIAANPQNPDHLFAGTDGYFLLTSRDGGDSWRSLFQGAFQSVYDVSISPHTPQTVFCAGPFMGAFRSDDGGSSWNALPALEWNSPLQIRQAPDNPNRIYIGTLDGQFYYSANAGSSFQNSPLRITSWRRVTVNRLAFHPANPSVLFAASSRGPLRSQDSGVTWGLLTPSLDLESLEDLLIAPGNPAMMWAVSRRTGLLSTLDGGATWQVTAAGTLLAPLTTVALGPTSNQVLAGSDGQGIYIAP